MVSPAARTEAGDDGVGEKLGRNEAPNHRAVSGKGHVLGRRQPGHLEFVVKEACRGMAAPDGVDVTRVKSVALLHTDRADEWSSPGGAIQSPQPEQHDRGRLNRRRHGGQDVELDP